MQLRAVKSWYLRLPCSCPLLALILATPHRQGRKISEQVRWHKGRSLHEAILTDVLVRIGKRLGPLCPQKCWELFIPAESSDLNSFQSKNHGLSNFTMPTAVIQMYLSLYINRRRERKHSHIIFHVYKMSLLMFIEFRTSKISRT